MLKEYLDKYVLVWKSIFNLNESMSRKDFWQFVLFNYLCYFVVSYLFSFWTYYFFNLLFLVFIISLILTGIKRLNDIHLPWPYLFFPFYNLYLLVQKGDDNLGGGKPVKEKAHLSFKSLGIAFVFSVVIFNAVFSGSPAGFFSIIDVFVFVGFAVVLFMICFVIIRVIAYSIVYEKIYPNLVFQILLPFFFIVSAAFIIYVIYYLNFSEGIYDFEEIIKHFVTSIVSYIAIFTIITGVIFSSEIPKKEIETNQLLNKNIQLLVAMTILIVIAGYLFYKQYKIQ